MRFRTGQGTIVETMQPSPPYAWQAVSIFAADTPSDMTGSTCRDRPTFHHLGTPSPVATTTRPLA